MLTGHMCDFLRGLVRMSIKKKEKGLAKLAPFPEQDPDEFEEVKRKHEAAIAWRYDVLDALEKEVDGAAVAWMRNVATDSQLGFRGPALGGKPGGMILARAVRGRATPPHEVVAYTDEPEPANRPLKGTPIRTKLTKRGGGR